MAFFKQLNLNRMLAEAENLEVLDALSLGSSPIKIQVWERNQA